MQNVMNTQEIIKSIDKIKNYNRAENISFDNIIRKIGELNNNYVTDNYNSLTNLKNDFSNIFIIVQKNHYNNEIILTSNVNKYIETNKKIEILFGDIKW